METRNDVSEEKSKYHLSPRSDPIARDAIRCVDCSRKGYRGEKDQDRDRGSQWHRSLIYASWFDSTDIFYSGELECPYPFSVSC